jgi:hypothetical protein
MTAELEGSKRVSMYGYKSLTSTVLAVLLKMDKMCYLRMRAARRAKWTCDHLGSSEVRNDGNQ